LPSSSRTFRVFVSSTFSDLEEERNALQSKEKEYLQSGVFPKLRELCMQNRCRFQAIDLRWGVREEAGLDQQTMKICIEEIKRCQKTKLKPNFIVLLGDRYGWRPAPPEISQDEFEEIKKHLSKQDTVLLEKWYLLDSNAKPPVYCLQPRVGEYRRQENWEAIEDQLRSILLKGIAMMSLAEKKLVKYFESATEQEINQGLDDPEAQKHVFCFFRTIEDIKEKPRQGFADLDKKTGKLDDEAYDRLNTLKDKLKTRLNTPLYKNCFEYQARLTDNGITLDHIDKLCNDVYNSLANVIQEEIKHIKKIDVLDKEVDDHAVFGEERARFFVGREAVLGSIKDYLGSGSHQPLAVFGESGSGKTSLMAHAVQKTREDFPDAEVVFRFIGATPSSTEGRSLLETLCQQIYKIFNFEEQKHRQIAGIEVTNENTQQKQQKQQQIETEYSIPIEYQKLSMTFNEFIKKIPKEEKAVIFLDALDQLSSTDHAQDLSWLPSVLPENVHIVVSCLPGECLSVLKKRLPPQNILIVKPMSRDEGEDLLKKWLYNVNRCLQPDQEKEVLEKFAVCGLPLYLKFAFEEARRWKSFTEKKELNPTIPGIILDLFKRLSSNENYGEKMFSHSLSYLAAAKNGLTEDELLDVLSLDMEVFDDFRKSSFHELTGDRLPVVVWSRLYFDLEPYFTERSADGTNLLGFYHPQLKEAVIQEFLKEDIKAARHALLGRYFNGEFKQHPQPLKFENNETIKKEKAVFNLRKLSELPFQESFGELWALLECTLTDLAFIEAKCASGMTYGLVEDFKVALDVLPERQEEKRREIEHKKRIKMYTRDMIAYARGEISSLEIIPSVEIWSERKIKAETDRIMCNPTRLDLVRAFSLFVNSESYALVKYASFPGFCLQHAYNFARSGPIADAAEKQKNIAMERILLLYESYCRPEYNPCSALLKTLESGPGVGVCCTADGKLAISGGILNDKSLRVWNVETGECKKTLTGHNCGETGVCCTPDGKLAIIGLGDTALRVWDLEIGECKKTLTGHTAELKGVCCTPDGKLAISASQDKTLRVWDVETGECKKTLTGHTCGVTGVCCTADGKLAISGGSYDDGTVRVWDLETGECKKTLTGHPSSVKISVCCTPDGKLAISGGTTDRPLTVWDLETGECKKTLTGRTSSVASVCCTPDGKLAISGGTDDKTVRVWDLETGECKKELSGHTAWVTSVCCTPDGKLAISRANDATVRVWDLETGECKKTQTGHTASVNSVCCTPDGKIALSADNVATIFIWDFETGKSKQVTKNRAFGHGCIYCAPNGKLAISAGINGLNNGGALNVWDLESGQCKKTLQSQKNFSNKSVCCTPDGRMALSAGNNYVESGAVEIWDLETGECKKTLTASNLVTSVCCTPDGKLALLGGNNGTVRVWDVETGECKKTLTGGSMVTSVCCTPDGKLAISGGIDKTVRVWDLETGECKKTLTGHTDGVTSVCCTPDGKLAISAGRDNTVRLWNIENGKIMWICQTSSSIGSLFAGSQAHFVIGDNMHKVTMLKLGFLDASPPLLSSVRLWLFEPNEKNGRWADEITTTCTWCGQRFVVEPKIIESIQNLSSRKNSTATETIEFSLQQNLAANCPFCNKPVRFNPFIVDNEKAVNALYEEHTVSKTPESNVQSFTQRPRAEPVSNDARSTPEPNNEPSPQKPREEPTKPEKSSGWKRLFKRR